MQPARIHARAERPRSSYVLDIDPAHLSCALLAIGALALAGLVAFALATTILGGEP